MSGPTVNEHQEAAAELQKFHHPFRAYSPADFLFPLPEGHRFPLYKYAGVRERLAGHLPILTTPQLRWAEAGLAHDAMFLRAWRRGEITKFQEREFGLPWSPEVVARAMRAAGGSLAALRDALEVGWGINLAGGTHHAFADKAGGFCLVNDAAILTRVALQSGWAARVAVLDLDVHQGDGTAAILAPEMARGQAFTLSIHGARNYPFRKQQSSQDIGLGDGVTDREYLDVLERQALRALEAFRPDLLLYLAGADVLAGDRFGRFELSLEGLRARNHRVLTWAHGLGLPTVTMMAGGYNHDHALTVAGHASVVEVGLEVFG